MQLGKYEIQEELGQGGFGTVYKALDRSLKRTVAIKVLHPNLVNDQTFLGRFRQEAQITARLEHSNLVPIYDYGESEGHYYIVMSYMPGGSLKDRIKNEAPFSKEAALTIIEQIAVGLEYSHNRHVIHRDLKPGNILFDEEGNSYISDLGFAKLLRSDASASMSSSGGIVGTPSYMAPEIWRGATASPATDIYSLACILVEMLTGVRLFDGVSTPEVMLKHFEPLQLPESLPEEWKPVLEAALEKKPEDRIDDVKILISELQSRTIRENSHINAGSNFSKPSYQKVQSKEPDVNEYSREKRKQKPNEVATDSSNTRSNSSNLLIVAGICVGIILVIAIISLLLNSLQQNNRVDTAPEVNSGNASQNLNNPQADISVSQAENVDPVLPNQNQKISSNDTFFAATQTTIPPTLTPQPTLTSEPISGSTKRRDTDGMEMVYVPEGSFTMGSWDGQDDEVPVREVYLDGYWIDKFEVTNRQYEQCVNAGVCAKPAQTYSNTRNSYFGNSQFADYPVIFIKWNDAQKYCRWVNADLPTEAQWEKAARGTDQRRYAWGDAEPNADRANSLNEYDDTLQVGSFPAGVSPYGAYDMTGNVWEWTRDYFSLKYDPNDTWNPLGVSGGDEKVMRGGSWLSIDMITRAANRNDRSPNYTDNTIGFRCVSP